MSTWPNKDRLWFEWPLLVLKISLIAVIPALNLYQSALSQPCLFPSTVLALMKQLYSPAGWGSLFAAVLLVTAGIAERLHGRWKQAAWDFGFAVFATWNGWAYLSMLKMAMK